MQDPVHDHAIPAECCSCAARLRKRNKEITDNHLKQLNAYKKQHWLAQYYLKQASQANRDQMPIAGGISTSSMSVYAQATLGAALQRADELETENGALRDRLREEGGLRRQAYGNQKHFEERFFSANDRLKRYEMMQEHIIDELHRLAEALGFSYYAYVPDEPFVDQVQAHLRGVVERIETLGLKVTNPQVVEDIETGEI